MKQTKTSTTILERRKIHYGSLILVNRANPICVDITEKHLIEIAACIRLEKQTALLYKTVLHQMGGASKIEPVSGYRSRAEQEHLFANSLAQHGAEYTYTYVALPGCSEHQTGIAIDVGQKAEDINFITPDFPYNGICQRFRETAVRYGFIQRYPQDKEDITGIGHELWHFRYVGIPHSELIAEMGFTLEEYIDWIRDFPFGSRPYRYETDNYVFEIGYVPAAEQNPTEIPLYGEPYTISGNNIDGFIVAVWRCV